MDETRRVFITGGTKGLGLCMAREFSKAGCPVFITGRSLETAKEAAVSLAAETGGGVFAGAGDSGVWEDTARLSGEAFAAMGGIDVWVNNAGVNQEPGMVWELAPEDMEKVVRTDFLGVMLGAKAAFEAMRENGGWVWFVEGHGSDGRIMAGLSAYGAAKRAVGYLWRALVIEAAGSKLKVGAVSPGIMITDFVMDSLAKQEGARRKRTVAVFNVLADRPETVAAWLVSRMLAARRSGVRVAWLTGAKIMWRFMTAPFTERRVIEE
ncbi:MAG: SDR family oxidoreductase [Rectinemataceae bacterium]|jgi:NAD(P)-dependent dehydrogenase (short-subunit alcohol dehydrogenase family)